MRELCNSHAKSRRRRAGKVRPVAKNRKTGAVRRELPLVRHRRAARYRNREREVSAFGYGLVLRLCGENRRHRGRRAELRRVAAEVGRRRGNVFPRMPGDVRVHREEAVSIRRNAKQEQFAFVFVVDEYLDGRKREGRTADGGGGGVQRGDSGRGDAAMGAVGQRNAIAGVVEDRVTDEGIAGGVGPGRLDPAFPAPRDDVFLAAGRAANSIVGRAVVEFDAVEGPREPIAQYNGAGRVHPDEVSLDGVIVSGKKDAFKVVPGKHIIDYNVAARGQEYGAAAIAHHEAAGGIGTDIAVHDAVARGTAPAYRDGRVHIARDDVSRG